MAKPVRAMSTGTTSAQFLPISRDTAREASMTRTKTFPLQRESQFFLTDGGIETEIMYKWGFDLPHFAMYPLLDEAAAMAARCAACTGATSTSSPGTRSPP